jgi:hypothetical protein
MTVRSTRSGVASAISAEPKATLFQALPPSKTPAQILAETQAAQAAAIAEYARREEAARQAQGAAVPTVAQAVSYVPNAGGASAVTGGYGSAASSLCSGVVAEAKIWFAASDVEEAISKNPENYCYVLQSWLDGMKEATARGEYSVSQVVQDKMQREARYQRRPAWEYTPPAAVQCEAIVAEARNWFSAFDVNEAIRKDPDNYCFTLQSWMNGMQEATARGDYTVEDVLRDKAQREERFQAREISESGGAWAAFWDDLFGGIKSLFGG